MNPSKYRCKTCEKDFIHLSYFYSHLNSTPHNNINCPLLGCLSKLSTVHSLQTHLSREHEIDKPFVVEDQKLCLKCPVKSCGLSIESRKKYLDHMPGHFDEGETFHCCYPECKAYCGTVASFRSHVSTVHALKYRKITCDKETSNNLSDDSDDSSDTVNIEKNVSQPRVTQDGKKIDQPRVTQGEKKIDQPQPQADVQDEDPFPAFVVKDQIAKFYLKLEAEHFLPTSTVQKVAEEIMILTAFSHHHLKNSLKPQLIEAGLADNLVTGIMENTFNSDPVYNTHHKQDSEQFCTDHLRQKFYRKNYPYVEPEEFYLGKDENGRNQFAHYISIRKSIQASLKDPIVKKKVLESFKITPKEVGPQTVLSDITDGSAYINHKRKQHNGGKCIYINLYQDGCDYNAFGPSVGKYKPNNFYYSLGNLNSEHRTQSSTIHLVYAILEKHLKNSEGEELKDVDKLKEVLKPLLDELEDLKINGIEIDGEIIPVCLLFSQGDNAGQHLIGGFVGSFSCETCCRFCDIKLKEFRANPTITKPLRTPEDYDQSVQVAKASWTQFRARCLLNVAQRKRRLLDRTRAPGSKFRVKRILAKSTFDKLKGIHHNGIKYRPSPLNSEKLQFHCCNQSLPPCIAHDLWEGIAKNMLPKIISTFVKKEWFDLATLNRRIESFRYDGSDKADAPTRLKSLKALGGNASENWNLVRFLPLLIGDLIEDQDDDMWQLYLKFKQVAEYVCAPKIKVQQVVILKSLISDYLLEVKRLLPECLYPKQHLLMHYPDLIMIYGPLSRLFTLRFESFHVFFKKVANSSKNFINFTYTLTRKYMCKFALDHSSSLLKKDVIYDYYKSSPVLESEIKNDLKKSIPESVFTGSYRVLTSVSVKGIEYSNDLYMILDSLDVCDLKVGKIELIFLEKSSNEVSFVLNVKPAINTFQGYYHVQTPAVSYVFVNLRSLPDYYPVPSYNVYGMQCLILKHSMIKM